MTAIANSLADLVGYTPLLRLPRLTAGLAAEVCAKLEYLNPLGSDKDRVALAMLAQAEADGRLTPAHAIIEATSGNLAFALAAYAVPRGYRVLLVMPDSMPVGRVRLLRALGAEVILTPATLGMRGSQARADALVQELTPAFRPAPFGNPATPAAHAATADEIWTACDGEVAVVICPVSTAGMVAGIGRRLKELSGGTVQIVAVQPASSPVLTGGVAGAHRLMGMGAPFIPEIYNPDVVDEVVDITDNECHDTLLRLYRTEGLMSGPAGGAALAAALRVAHRAEMAGGRIVALIPDSMERYNELPFWETFTVVMPG